MKSALLGCFLVLLFRISLSSCSADEPVLQARDLREGDLLFEQSTSSQAAMIQQATHSKWTHVAVALRPKRGEPLTAFEAAGPVGFVSIKELLARSKDGRLTVKRLRHDEDLLIPKNLEALRGFFLKQQGKPYDALFLWDDDAMYCSKLVWKGFKSALDIELGKPGKWSDLNLQSPAVMATIRERYARRNLPLDMNALMHTKIVTPASMYDSSLLEDVGILKAPR